MKLVATTPLPGFTGDFDHFAVDLKGKRLFLTAEDHKTVEVFDLDGKRIKSIAGFGQPHAILFMPDVNKFIVTDGDGFGMVELVSGVDYKILNTIKLPPGVDGAVFNPVNKYYYVESGGEETGRERRTRSTSSIPRRLNWSETLRFPEITRKPWPSRATARKCT